MRLAELLGHVRDAELVDPGGAGEGRAARAVVDDAQPLAAKVIGGHAQARGAPA